MLLYRRDVPADRLSTRDTIAHIRAHLSAVADPDDDPDTYAKDVRITVSPHVDRDPGMVTVLGELDAEPDAPYLRDGWTPEQDIEANPLSVSSITGGTPQ